MADVSDVLSTLAGIIAAVLYPNGTASPSVLGVDCRVYPGWPAATGLDADLRAGKVNVSIFPRDDESNTTRYPVDWQPVSTTPAAITITTGTTTATLGGSIVAGNNVGLNVNGAAYVYTTQGGDTLATVATALATLISANTPATSAGPVITIPSARLLVGRVGATGTSSRELGRQKRSIQIAFWCSSDAQRSLAVPLVDTALRGRNFITMPDGSACRLIYASSPYYGQGGEATEKAILYRRDLIYSAEWATTETRTDASILFPKTSLSAGVTGAETLIKTIVD